MSPLAHITNEEMYAILARIAKTEEGSTMLSHVPDQTDIASWAKKSVEQAIVNGYVAADKDYKLNPKNRQVLKFWNRVKQVLILK